MRAFVPVLSALAVVAAACSAVGEPTAGTSEEVKAGADLTELSLPLDAKTLTGVLTARGIRSKSDALAILPHAMKQRFVLVKNTGALGVASPERPRIIHFAEDARFIVASTGHKIDEDITARSLEILEQDEATHTYRTHTITIDPVRGAELIEDDRRCKGCHGSPARPIWGSYPSWPAAYGSDDDKMTPEEHASFDGFLAIAKTDPDYRHLELHPSSYGFDLPLPYGYPNTVFGSVIGDRFAIQLAARMQKSPLLPQLQNALIATSLYCNPSAGVASFVDQMYSTHRPAVDAAFPAQYTATKIYRLLGVEPTTDLRLENTVLSPPTVNWEVGYSPYDVGSDYLTNVVAFPIFRDVLLADPALADLYASKRYAIDDLDRLTIKGDLAGLQALTRDTTPSYYEAVLPPIYNYIHAPVHDGEGKHAAICAHLDAMQLAAQRP